MWGTCGFRAALFVALLMGIWFGPSPQAQATQVEYVKVCSLYGAGFYYVPGTDTCIKLAPPTFRDGTICTFGGKPYFADGQGCPSRSADAMRVYQCRGLGAGVYADSLGVCGGIRTDSQSSDYRAFTSRPIVERWNGRGWGVDVGVSTGANVYSPNFGFLRGFDSLAAPAVRTDQRDIGLGSTSAMLGFDVNVWTAAPLTPVTPVGTRMFIQTSVMFPIDSSTSQTVTGVNVFPQGTATTEYKSNYQIGVFAGFSYDLNRGFGYPSWGYPNWGTITEPRLRIGGGGVFNNHKISVWGTDTSGIPFSSSRSATDFEPGFLIGLKGNVGSFSVGLDVINTFPCFFSTTAQSGFPSQTYKGAVDGGVNTTVKITLAKDITDLFEAASLRHFAPPRVRF